MTDPDTNPDTNPDIRPNPKPAHPLTACKNCPDTHNCSKAWAQPSQGPLQGAKLSLTATLVFLLPLLCAVITAVLARYFLQPRIPKHHLVEPIAALVGLLLGAGWAWVIFHVFRKRLHDAHYKKENRSWN